MATALLAAILSLAITPSVSAQTIFTFSATGANYATGAADPNSGGAVPGSGPVANGSAYSSGAGTSLTVGQDFSVLANGTSSTTGTAAWLYVGTSTVAPVSAGTLLPISWDFTLAENSFIIGDVPWVLFYKGGANNSEIQIASGTLTSASQTFTGSTTYDYVFASNTSDTFRTYLGVSFTTNIALGQGEIDATMANGGLGGPGITINATVVPEPSAYAAIAGAAVLGLALWRRRRTATMATLA